MFIIKTLKKNFSRYFYQNTFLLLLPLFSFFVFCLLIVFLKAATTEALLSIPGATSSSFLWHWRNLNRRGGRPRASLFRRDSAINVPDQIVQAVDLVLEADVGGDDSYAVALGLDGKKQYII